MQILPKAMSRWTDDEKDAMSDSEVEKIRAEDQGCPAPQRQQSVYRKLCLKRNYGRQCGSKTARNMYLSDFWY